MGRGFAVDIDNTLAGTHEAFIDAYNARNGTSYVVADLVSWDFDETPVTYEEFHGVTQDVWREWERIPPSEPFLAEKLLCLNAYGPVDIVTAREERDVEIRSWLRRQGIRQGVHYGDFVVEHEKQVLGYDLYVDDNPLLAEKAPTVLYAQDYNAVAEQAAVGRGTFEDVLAVAARI